MNLAPPIRPRVARGGTLVLGGGFAGATSPEARACGRDRRQPDQLHALHAAAPRGGGRHGRAAARARADPPMCPHADLLLGAAVELDHEHRRVIVASDAGRFGVTYSDLVVALGSVTRMPRPGLREHAFGLKDVGDAIRLRNHVLRQIELADAAPDRRAAAHVRVRRRRLRGRRDARRAPGADRRRAAPPPAARRRRARAGCSSTARRGSSARRRRGSRASPRARSPRRGVEILTETSLESADAGGVELSGGRRIESETIVWTAGVTPTRCSAARAAARRPWPRARRRDARGRGHGRRVGARRLRRGPRTPPRPATPTRRPASTRCVRRGGSRATCAARPSPTATARRARWPRLAAATASRPPARCVSAASPAGSSPAATTCWPSRSPRAARACSPTGRRAAVFRRDVVEVI